MAHLLRRSAALVLIFAMMLLTMPDSGLGDGRAVLADVQDNGQVDGCYTRAELRDALNAAEAQDRIYGNAIDLIRQAQIDRVQGESPACGGPGRVPGTPPPDRPGDPVPVWAVLGLVAGGAGVAGGVGGRFWARRGKRR